MNQISKLTSLPEFLSSRDLVDLGLYPTTDAIYVARMRGNSPDFIKLKRKILYPKTSLIEFIERHTRRGDVPTAEKIEQPSNDSSM